MFRGLDAALAELAVAGEFLAAKISAAVLRAELAMASRQMTKLICATEIAEFSNMSQEKTSLVTLPSDRSPSAHAKQFPHGHIRLAMEKRSMGTGGRNDFC